MTSYKIEFSFQGKSGKVYFDIYEYNLGVRLKRLAQSLSANEAKDLIEQILAGEREYVIVPKEYRLIKIG